MVMLATTYKGDINYPVYCQPKLDGIRCMNGKSRNGKEFATIGHIEYEDYFDGELMAGTFRETCSFVKRKEAKEGGEIVKLHVYDLNIPGTFTERLEELNKLEGKYNNVEIVETVLIENEEDLNKYYGEKLSQGYEGIMIRDPDSLYELKRSKGLQKYKPKFDSEFKIVDIVEGKGKLEGHAGYVVFSNFKASVGGTYDYRKELLENKENYIGKLGTVEYQEMSYEGVPRFPVLKGIRDYE